MRTEPPFYLPQPPFPLTTLFNLADHDERFMAGWIARVHTEPPQLFRALDLKRSERWLGNKPERLVYEFARWQGRPRQYLVIIWNVDEISMWWKEWSRRSEAIRYYQTLSSSS